MLYEYACIYRHTSTLNYSMCCLRMQFCIYYAHTSIHTYININMHAHNIIINILSKSQLPC